MNTNRFVERALAHAVILTLVLILTVPAMAAGTNDTDGNVTLWYDEPAKEWHQALPVGNGRLGAMLFGGTQDERILLNEETIWTGGPYQPANPKGAKAVSRIRELVFERKYAEAHKLFGRTMMAWPVEQMKYQYLGNLWLRFPGHDEATDYRRQLDMSRAIAQVTYRVDGVKFTREVLATAVDQVIVVHLTADKPGKISFTANITGLKDNTHSNYADDFYKMNGLPPDELFLWGKAATYLGIEGKIKYQARVKAIADGGKITVEGDDLTVTDADSVMLLIPAATNFVNYKKVNGNPEKRIKKVMNKIKGKSYEQIRKDHIADHQRLFGRVKLDLGQTEASKKPINERIGAYADSDDPQLAALMFQFGRYLMVCGSRPGTQPTNLQGIWNSQYNPSWDSKYTTNINFEMNYWLAEVCNLAECHEPLFKFMSEVAQTGAYTAKVSYGARGWVLHQNSDLWRATAPMDGPLWGTWATGGAWLCSHLWEHYLFSEDKQYLKKVYPIMKGSAIFFLDTLVEHPTYKYLVTCPSSSPENTPTRPDAIPFWDEICDMKVTPNICAGTTMDMQILRYLFDSCIRASEILDKDKKLRGQMREARRRLAPNLIGRHGQLQEWLEDWDNPKDAHRHFSHLWGMYPGNEISARRMPQLTAAVAKSLQLRGEGGTGFGMAWQICLWARMFDGDRAHKMLTNLITRNTCSNLFSKCFSSPQVDGSYGATAGIAQMLLQSHEGEIDLLPALPKAWPTGHVKGLRARGGFEVDIDWKDGKLTKAVIRSLLGNTCRVRYGEQLAEFETNTGKSLTLNSELK